MNELITTALMMTGLFVICYPVVMFLLNRTLTKIRHENHKERTIF